MGVPLLIACPVALAAGLIACGVLLVTWPEADE